MRHKRKQCISTHLIGIDIGWTMIKVYYEKRG
jgi:hypothetical protein